MRKLAILLCATFVVAAASCDKDPIGNTLPMTVVRYTVPAGLNPVFAHNLALDNISTDHQRLGELTGVPWADWVRVAPQQASLQIIEPGLDWSFAFEVTLKAFTDDPNNTRELFYRDQIPEDVGSRLDLIPTDFNAKAVLDEEDVGLILELRRLRNSPPQSIPVSLEWSFEGFTE